MSSNKSGLNFSFLPLPKTDPCVLSTAGRLHGPAAGVAPVLRFKASDFFVYLLMLTHHAPRLATEIVGT